MSDTPNNITKLLRALTAPVQALEDMLQQLMSERSIDTAVGKQLDVIGRLAGQPRLGLDDETYRRYIRARIAAHNSDGTTEDLITVATLIVYDDDATYEVDNHGNGSVIVRVRNIAISQALADILISFLKAAVSGGVRVILEYSHLPPATWFKWDTPGRGWDTGSPFLDAKS